MLIDQLGIWARARPCVKPCRTSPHRLQRGRPHKASLSGTRAACERSLGGTGARGADTSRGRAAKRPSYLRLPIWLPTTPPTAAPPTVPAALPSVSTEPATPPMAAPAAVALSR